MLLTLISILIGLGVLGLIAPRLITSLYSQSRVFKDINGIPSYRAAIVFGAGLQKDGTPSPVLRDRVAAAVQLYQAGKVEKILMSGDNRFVEYNEPGAMFNYAIELGMPAEDIVLDYAGRRTYDTCYRAKAIFALKEAILVTQTYHLSRALFTCNMLGLTSVGYTADLRTYHPSSYFYWNLREIPATFMTFVDVWFRHPTPVLGNQEPIFPN
jgi:SanA protein